MKKTIALLLCLSLILSFSAPATAMEAVKVETNNVTEKTELISKRDVYSKTYILPDGSYQYVAYATPVHYKDGTGTYAEIDNKITDAVNRDGYKYTNTANGWNAYFAEEIGSNNAVMMTSGKYNISFSFVGQTGTAKVIKATDVSVDSRKGTASTYYQKLRDDDRAVVYSNVVENVDIAYTVKTGALKEDIILKSKQAPSVFRFHLTTNGLTLKKSGDTFGLFAATGEEIFTFAPLYMEDANGKRSENVSLQFDSVKNGYEITVSADVSFLNDVDTAYPVVIDPSLMVTGSGVTYDTYVDLEYPNSNYYLSENLWTGGSVNSNVVRTYIKFDMPNGVGGSQVTSAYINIRKKDYETPTFKAYRVSSSWSSSAITWNSKPSYSSFDSSGISVNSTGDWYQLDVTDMVGYWLSGVHPNYGVILKATNETDASNLTKFYSSDAPSPNKPELIINYTEGSNFAHLVGVDAVDPVTLQKHDHESSLGSIQTYLEIVGYTPQIHLGSFSINNIKKYLIDDVSSVFVSRSHGGYQESNGIQQNTYIVIKDGITFTSDIELSSLDLSHMDLVMFVGCATGRGGEYGNNLPHQAVIQGAVAAVGFEETIHCDDANIWLIQFWRLMELHYSISSACALLSVQGQYIGTGLENVVLCGNSNIILN